MRDSKGRFIKGHIGYKYWQGKKFSPEYKKKLSNSHKGQIAWNKNTKGICKQNKNSFKKGIIPWSKIVAGTGQLKAWNKGLKFPYQPRPLMKGKISHFRNKKRPELTGKNHPNWQGGITSINLKIRNSLEYKIWRENVFERDDYTCKFCKKRGLKLHADHIKPFAFYPELRFDISNGRTLCISCHQKTDTWGGKSKKKI